MFTDEYVVSGSYTGVKINVDFINNTILFLMTCGGYKVREPVRDRVNWVQSNHCTH